MFTHILSPRKVIHVCIIHVCNMYYWKICILKLCLLYLYLDLVRFFLSLKPCNSSGRHGYTRPTGSITIITLDGTSTDFFFCPSVNMNVSMPYDVISLLFQSFVVVFYLIFFKELGDF